VNAAIEGATRDPAHATESENLPAVIEPRDAIAAQTISRIPDVTRAAARWIRPLVPGVIARAIDSSTHPLRTARQVIEEVEEITFSLRRIRTVTIQSEESPGTAPTLRTAAFDSECGPDSDPSATIAAAQPLSPRPFSQESADVQSAVSGRGESRQELTERDGPAELRSSDGPRQLPPAE
jgi:hypothetical protein